MARKKFWTYTKSTPDRYLDKLCSGAWYDDTAGASTYLWVGLLNEGQAGDLHVWSISAAMDGANVMAGVVRQGAVGGRVAGCFPVKANGVNPAAGIYSQRTGPAAPPSIGQAVPAGTHFLIGTSFGSPQFTPAHPIVVLPPGWSVTIVSDFQTLDGGASFWFVVL